jgi:poly(3-hydroxybutyrate) depolymerase
MLYLLYEFSRASAAPWLYAAQLGRRMLSGWPSAFAGCSVTEAAHALCSSLPQAMHKHLESPDTGHYGIFGGSRFRGAIAPALRQFISEHN